MNRYVQFVALIVLMTAVGHCLGNNPIFGDVFTADPAAMVIGDTVYVYVGHNNAKEGQLFTIPDWRCYSSKDMKTWTSHGSIMRPEEFKFARPNADIDPIMFIDDDGTIKPITQTKSGVSGDAEPPKQSVQLFPLKDVRLLESPFFEAVKANRHYLLAHNPDRLLAPFRREAGLELKAPPYGNWESDGLDGHTSGHYLSALSFMIASGADSDGEFRRRLNYMIDELAEVQKANGNGYIGGIPGNRDNWKSVVSKSCHGQCSLA